MVTRAKDIIDIMEKHFPLYLAEDWDNSGLQVGSLHQEVKRCAIALELDAKVIDSAIEKEVDLLITHHPLIFKPLKNINLNTSQGNLIQKLIQNKICLYVAHTNLDAAEYGLNQVLAEVLELKDIKPLYQSKQEELYKLAVFVPVNHVSKVRTALTDAGAGCIGNYSDCTFRSQGIGTFRPGENTNPFIGNAGELEEVDECKLETILYKRDLNKIIEAMEKAHPYEEVAYDVYPVANQGKSYSLGRIGYLDSVMRLRDYAVRVKEQLGLDSIRIAGDQNIQIKKVAVISGAGASLLDKALAAKADVLVTGDVKYHEAREAVARGISIIDAGHQGTEEIVVPFLRDFLEKQGKLMNLPVSFSGIYTKRCFFDI